MRGYVFGMLLIFCLHFCGLRLGTNNTLEMYTITEQLLLKRKIKKVYLSHLFSYEICTKFTTMCMIF